MAPALKFNGLPVEFQSWGHSHTQVVNLHLMLANDLTEFFESPIPEGPFRFGILNGKLVTDGQARAPAGAGLGLEVDWEGLSKADFYRHAVVEPKPD